MEKIYRVQMNSSGMPNFATAVEIDTEISEYSDKLWKNAYERGKADRRQGEWLDTGKDPSHSHPLTAIWYKCSECGDGINTKTNYCPSCGARMKGADDE